ncbi:PH domain-containing protein [Clostridium sartagoforme]|uniref:PH domain-containing protein n=1 Tax=Clostridium sartagoforme TaxID=84031 RepID=UPI0031E0D18D
MKEYKGYGGNKVTIDGENILIKQAVQKEECNFNDIKSVNFVAPTLFKNGMVIITTQKASYKVIFLKKSLNEFKELYDYIYQKIYIKSNDSAGFSSQEDNKNEISRNANDMYQYCIDNNYGMGLDKSWSLKHFQLIENALSSDEKVLMCFIGLHNYVSSGKHDSNFAYAVTNKRIIMAQKKMVGEIIQTISLKNVNDITMTTGAITGIITIDTIKETFNVSINKSAVRKINDKIHELLLDIQESKPNSSAQTTTSEKNCSSADEILKFKNLLDMGVITEEEFNIKKKQLLGI